MATAAEGRLSFRTRRSLTAAEDAHPRTMSRLSTPVAAGPRVGARTSASAGSEICALLAGCAPNVYPPQHVYRPLIVTLVVLVGLYFAVRNFMRARR